VCVAALFAAATPATAHAESSWPTYHHDAVRSGVDPENGEPIEPVQAWQSAALGAPIWSQPLVYEGTVYVATVGDVLYALNAETGSLRWKRRLGVPVPAGELECGDVKPTVGVVGTPVIDPATLTIYAVADTWNATTREASHVLRGYTLAGQGVLNTPVDPPGANPRALLQRTALNLDQGSVVFGFGGNDGDCGEYSGTVVAAPEDGSAPRYWRYQPAPPSDGGAAVWGTSGPAVDAAGDIYASTGNPNPGGSAATYDYSDSLIQLDTGLHLIGSFEPETWLFDSNHDLDLGSAGPELLPGGLLFQAGKNGTGYLIAESGLGAAAPAVYSKKICGGHGTFGGDAFDEGVIYIPCTNGTEALAYNEAARTFTPLWHGPSDAFGPPIVSTGLVWVAATGGFSGGGTHIYGLEPATGKARYTLSLPSPIADHFGSPSAAGGRLFMATGSTVTAFQIAKPGSPPATAPSALTGAASAVGEEVAVLNATVNPNGGAVTDCHFDYGPSIDYGKTAACNPSAGSGTAAVAVAATIEGLSAGTTYHFRVVASGPAGFGEGVDHTFTTAKPAPLMGPPPGPGDPGSPAAASAQGALAFAVVAAPRPSASLAARSIAVGRTGRLLLPVHCASGESVCTGKVTLSTLHAVRARAGRGRAARTSSRVLTLTTGTFTVPGGSTRLVTLRLRTRARALLARTRSLPALATLEVHNAAGAGRTTHVTVVLHLAGVRRG
jgi:outer membrane protein assembly factor BamB